MGSGEHLKLEKILLSKETIGSRVAELAEAIEAEYRGCEVTFVCVLKGAAIFMSDLVRAIGETVDVRMDFMAVSSYGAASTTSGVVKIQKDMDVFAEGRHVILVEDIMDTGLTMQYLEEIITARKPASFKTCVLLEKPERKKVDMKMDYTGFTIPDKFVVGYGLDFAGKWRHLPDIWCVAPGA